MRVVLMQSPMVGGAEDTAAALAGALAVPYVHFIGLVRFHVRRRTELGRRALDVMNAGEAIPDALASAIVRSHLHDAAPAAGFLLAGHPHSAAQARALDSLLHELGTPLDAVVQLHLDSDDLERRIHRRAARRICRDDSNHVHEATEDDRGGGDVCLACGGELYQRNDDREGVIRDRCSRYEELIRPVIRHFAEGRRLVVVDAAGSTEEVIGRALAALRGHGR